MQDLAARIVLGGKGQVDIGPVKPVQESLRRLPVKQPRHDLFAGLAIRRRGKGRQRHVKRAAQLADAQVIGAEIMAPLADAMRLVHGDQRHADAPQHAQRRPRSQPFGRDIQQLEPPGLQRIPHFGGLFLGIARGQRPGLYPGLAQRAHLVAHQRDQRRNHQRHPVAHQRGQLETQRLAATRGHDRQHVVAARHGIDDILLTGPKAVEPENITQNRGSGAHEWNPLLLVCLLVDADHPTTGFAEQAPSRQNRIAGRI